MGPEPGKDRWHRRNVPRGPQEPQAEAPTIRPASTVWHDSNVFSTHLRLRRPSDMGSGAGPDSSPLGARGYALAFVANVFHLTVRRTSSRLREVGWGHNGHD